jgi:hypothetical protein
LDALSVVLVAFGTLELLNVLTLYLAPGSRRGNALGVFLAYERSKEDPRVHALVRYLIDWVAGTKLIFIVLLIGIILTGSPTTKVFTVIALIFSILTFYTRLYPAITKMDREGQIAPRGYSRTLVGMIAAFVIVFGVAVVVYLVNYAAP